MYLFCVLLGGVFVSMTHGPNVGVLGFVFVFPERQLVVVPPSGEHARRLDFLDERFLNKSLLKLIIF